MGIHGEKQRLVRLQKHLLAAYQRELKAAGVCGPPTLVRLKASLFRWLRRLGEPQVTSYGRLLTAARRERVILVGDYHTLRRSQSVAESFLATLVAEGRRPTLLLECFTSHHDPLLKAWQMGVISTERLRRVTMFDERWGFAWEGYNALLERARTMNLTVLGLESPKQLRGIKARDRAMATRIAGLLKRDRKREVVALVGDLHLAGQALPAALADHDLTPFRLFQNLEPLYWQLVSQGPVPEGCLVELDPLTFCIMDAHPLLKVQSTLNWLDGLLTLEENGVHQGLSERLEQLVQSISEWLQIPLVSLDRLQVHSTDPMEFLAALEQELEPGQEAILSKAIDEIRSTGIYVHPPSGLIYLANPTVNHAAEAATLFLYDSIRASLPRFDEGLAGFLNRTLRHGVGWLGSLIINPQRLPMSPHRVAPLFEERRPGQAVRSALALADRLLQGLAAGPDSLEGVARAVARAREPVLLLTAKLLGERLGRAWFLALEEGRIECSRVSTLFQSQLVGEVGTFTATSELIYGLGVGEDVQQALVGRGQQPVLRRSAGGEVLSGEPDD